MNLDDDPITEISKAIRPRKKLETQVRGDFQSALPVLKFTSTKQSTRRNLAVRNHPGKHRHGTQTHPFHTGPMLPPGTNSAG